jgi:hypothetical protein
MHARVLLIVGLIVAVLAVLLGMRFRIMMAGGKAIVVLAIIGLMVWLAFKPRPRNPG